MIVVKRIDTTDPHYQKERELRNEVLLRPIGIPDFGWEMNDEMSWHFVALKDNEVIGCVMLYPLDDNNSEAQLMQMAVDNTMQHKGIGKMLVTNLLDFARDQKIKQIVIHSRSEVNSFYMQFGFRKIGKDFEEVGIKHSYLTLLL